jgi:adenylate cyclase
MIMHPAPHLMPPQFTHGDAEPMTDRPRQTFGELVPLGGGDPIPLLKPKLIVGRRESSDIVLRFPNVSGTHCELTVVDGHWLVKDRGSSNGTKVNGSRVTEQRLESGDKISFGRNVYEIFYNPAALGADVVAGGDVQTDVFATSLLSAAGLERRRAARDSQSRR